MFCPSLKWRVIAQKWTVEVTIAKNLLGHLVPSSEQRRIENTLQEILNSAVFVFLFLPYSFFFLYCNHYQYIQKFKKQPQMPV